MPLSYMVKQYKIKSKLRNKTRKNLRGGDVELENIIEKLMDEVDILKATVEKDRQTIGSLEIDVSDLQQKVVDLDINAVVMIGYKRLSGTPIPISVNKNISKDKFMDILSLGMGSTELITPSLEVIYSLQNVRGLPTYHPQPLFTIENREENQYLGMKDFTYIKKKYPGLFQFH